MTPQRQRFGESETDKECFEKCLQGLVETYGKQVLSLMSDKFGQWKGHGWV